MGVIKYSEEFRQSAVSLVIEKGKTPVEVGRELGVAAKTIREWVKNHSNRQQSEYQRIAELEREVKKLKHELADSRETVEILKKTAIILGQK